MPSSSNVELLNLSLPHLLHRARQGIDAFIDHACQKTPFGLTARQLIVLMTLEACEQSSQTTLVELTGMDRSTLSDVMRRLQRKGWVRRRRSSRDKRAYVITISESGHAALAVGKVIMVSASAVLLDTLPPERRAVFQDLLEILTERPSGSQA